MGLKSDRYDLRIVLTGTIIPNTTIDLKHLDPKLRRKEYLNSIHFYRQFAPVYFLENSAYDLESDPDFQDIPDVTIYQFNASSPSKGKGFQEFEMLDRWIDTEPNLPARWIKVTGRYHYPTFHKILHECIQTPHIPLLIDQYLFAKHCDTALFAIKTEFYQANIYGLYQSCDDLQGLLIEKVMFAKLRHLTKRDFKRFSSYLRYQGIAGNTGKKIDNRWVDSLNSIIRGVNYWIDRHYIWLSF